MRRFRAGHKVFSGTYWNVWDLRMVGVNNEAILPGDRHSVYYRIPFALAFPLGLLQGGIYVFILPVVSIITAVSVLGKWIFGNILFQARRSVFFGWRPTEAYLAGKKRQIASRDRGDR
jgi:hypothetical protein